MEQTESEMCNTDRTDLFPISNHFIKKSQSLMIKTNKLGLHYNRNVMINNFPIKEYFIKIRQVLCTGTMINKISIIPIYTSLYTVQYFISLLLGQALLCTLQIYLQILSFQLQ